jgi:hypothetical protein
MTEGSAEDTVFILGSRRAENRHIYLLFAEPLSASGCCTMKTRFTGVCPTHSPLSSAVDSFFR